MTVNEILNTARNEIGYREGANNDNKYGIEYGMNNEPWCVIFLWWCFRHSNAGDLFPNTAHCDGVRSHAKAVGGWLDRAELESAGLKPGDLVIWDYNSDGSGDHIGIVESVDEVGFTSIEGNCADSVCRVQRTLEGVSGAYRPLYEEENGENTQESGNDYLVRFGDRGSRVRIVQAVLMLKGFNLGPCGIDGEFGEMTERAVKSFQGRNALAADGIVGVNTLRAMWKEE